jgi:DsbC/DsbD-like thiol-disulfide interchange protein
MTFCAPQMLALGLALFTQVQPMPDPVRWSLALSAQRPVARASTVAVKLKAEIRSGWHLYSIGQPPGGPIATEISLPVGQPFTFAKPITAQKPHVIFDPGFGMPVQLYTDTAEFVLPIKVAATAPSGAQTLTVEARYQSCNDNLCLPPRTTKTTLVLQIREK